MKKFFLLFLLLLAFGAFLKSQSYGDIVKISHVLTNTHLHSHPFNYGHPNSSGQQQVTAFGGADDNDFWIIKPEHGNSSRSGNIQNGAIIRLEHYLTHRNLHSHAGIPSPVTAQQEVTCFGENGTGDSNDNWRIEIEGGGAWSLNQRIRLIHVNTNYALHSHAGFSHPIWTANQQEVTCFGGRDDNDWWRLTEVKPNLFTDVNIRRFPILKAGVSTTIGRSNNTQDPRYSNESRTESNGESCTTRKVDFTESNFERIISGGIWDKIYPGVIYQAGSVADGTFTTLNLPRNPLTIATNLVSAISQRVSTTIQPTNINRSGVWQGISYLLNQNRGVINASRALFEMKQIYSKEQLQVFVGGDFTGWGASVQATFNTSNSQTRNVYIVKLTQAYFDIVVDDNQNLVTVPPNDDNAVYIHAVSYGKIGYLRIESNESEQTIRATLNARYNWGTGNAGVQASVDFNRVFRESQTVGFVLGGSPQVITSAEQFNQYVQDARWNPNVQIQPISYKLKYLRDRSDAYVSMTTSYTERKCEPIRRGSSLQVTAISGSDDLRSYNTAYLTVNFNDGTSTQEFLILRGLGQNQTATKTIDLGREIDLVNVRSITIRNDGTPNNNPFNGGDAGHTYDNWDLNGLRVSLVTGSGIPPNIYNNANPSAADAGGDKVPVRFTGDKRTAEFMRQPQ